MSSRKRILYFDDDGGSLNLLRELLELKGFDVTTCNTTGMSADEALTMVERKKPNIVLTDVQWDSTDSLNQYGLILTHKLKGRFPVVVISADEDNASMAESYGARFSSRSFSSILRVVQELSGGK